MAERVRPDRGAVGSYSHESTDDDVLAAPTRRVLFGPLTSTDVSGAVVRRLRAAIGLGLLADGDRLPRESDLAAQLGIATFSLREALGQLRDQGLLVTRPGKFGGSFVTYPIESEEIERDELLRLTSAELRDLGDWRHMLAAHSAALAAQRASESNYRRLENFAKLVGEAETSQQARRAHGRFHVELASAAQSLRMTRAEFGVHEEIDWLFGLALRTSERRAVSSHGLLEITDAVRSHDPNRARAAAETYSSRLMAELAQLRLETIAARYHKNTSVAERPLDREIGDLTAALLALLKAVARDAAPLFDGHLDEQELRSQVSVAILRRFGQLPPFVDAIVILAEVGAVPEHPFWTEAWHRTESGPRKDDSHVMNPSREDFYDYESYEFMAKPRQLLQPWAMGPYVDYGGADNYIVTIAAPILRRKQFLGVAVADFQVADLERQLAPWLAMSEEVRLLLNWENRVIVSNSSTFSAGDLVLDHRRYTEVKFPLFGWSLLTETRRPKGDND